MSVRYSTRSILRARPKHLLTMAFFKRIITFKRTAICLLACLFIAACVFYINDVQIRSLDGFPERRSLLMRTSSGSNFEPILVMGLPRSGSMALHNFFQCNGLKSAHYCCGNSPKSSFSCGTHPTCGACVLENLQKSQPAFSNCGNDYQVFAQFDVEASEPFEWFIPQHFALPLLHKDYPEAIWILNRRENANVWADSVLHWYSISLRLMNSFGLNYHQYPPKESTTQDKFPLIGPQVDMTEQEVQDCLADAYDTAISKEDHSRRWTELTTIYDLHLQKIRKFVQDNPSHRLIEINVDDPSASDVLVKAFPGYKPNCWNFDAQDYDGDWKDFTLKV
jgi:hypothetical protein